MIDEKSMTLGTDYTRDVNPVGWFASEKYDGCRAYWCGSQLWTRGGNVIPAPQWFIDGMPKGVQLDGEIWCGYGKFEAARLAVQFGQWHGNERFMVFDAPRAIGNWPQRIQAAALLINGRSKIASTVTGFKVASRAHLRKMVEDVKAIGGEGVVIRNPKITRYETGVTSNLLKIKNPNVI